MFDILGIFFISILHVRTEKWWSACRKCKTLKSVGEIYPCNRRKLACVLCHTLWQKLLQPSPKDADGKFCPFKYHGSEMFTARTCYPLIGYVL